MEARKYAIQCELSSHWLISPVLREFLHRVLQFSFLTKINISKQYGLPVTGRCYCGDPALVAKLNKKIIQYEIRKLIPAECCVIIKLGLVENSLRIAYCNEWKIPSMYEIYHAVIGNLTCLFQPIPNFQKL